MTRDRGAHFSRMTTGEAGFDTGFTFVRPRTLTCPRCGGRLAQDGESHFTCLMCARGFTWRPSGGQDKPAQDQPVPPDVALELKRSEADAEPYIVALRRKERERGRDEPR